MVDTHKIDKINKYVTDDPIHQIHEHGIDIYSNQIYLFGDELYNSTQDIDDPHEPGIEYIMTNKFIRNLNILMRKSEKPILIHMKTCGGLWSEGMAIYDAIKACPNPVTILNYTHARSMSSLIFQAANKRIMMINSIFMFHQGTIHMGGTVKQAYTEIKQTKLADKIMINIYIDQMKKNGKFKTRSRETIEKILREEMDKKEEVYLTSKETVEYGLADEIFGLDGIYNWSKLLEYNDYQMEV